MLSFTPLQPAPGFVAQVVLTQSYRITIQKVRVDDTKPGRPTPAVRSRCAVTNGRSPDSRPRRRSGCVRHSVRPAAGSCVCPWAADIEQYDIEQCDIGRPSLSLRTEKCNAETTRRCRAGCIRRCGRHRRKPTHVYAHRSGGKRWLIVFFSASKMQRRSLSFAFLLAVLWRIVLVYAKISLAICRPFLGVLSQGAPVIRARSIRMHKRAAMHCSRDGYGFRRPRSSRRVRFAPRCVGGEEQVRFRRAPTGTSASSTTHRSACEATLDVVSRSVSAVRCHGEHAHRARPPCRELVGADLTCSASEQH